MLKRACIAVVDAAHARLYTYAHLGGEPPAFSEVLDLVNPGRQAHGMFADKQSRAIGVGRTGKNRHQAGGHGAVDDHRLDHVAELEARFAKAVVGELDRIMREQAFQHVILVANPKMLGTLRAECDPLRRPEIVIDEVLQDFAWLTSPQIHDRLAEMKLIAARPGATLRDAR